MEKNKECVSPQTGEKNDNAKALSKGGKTNTTQSKTHNS